MSSFFYLLTLYLLINNVESQKDEKSSLTFVIDDTGSMRDDIKQVKMAVNDIFNAVQKSNDSQIENYVLVTFNDPGVILRTVTKKKKVFEQALDNVNVWGGGNCPEYCMGGIEKALEVSLPGSYLYVSTDALARDYNRYKHVSALAQSKGCQINFLLTGTCHDTDNEYTTPGYKEYYDLSRISNGQVFHLEKTDLRDILDYVIQNVKGRRTNLARGEFPPGKHELNYTVDHKTTDVIIATSAKNPKVKSIDPDGKPTKLEKIVEKENIAIYGNNASKPGVHKVTVESKSTSTVLVTGKTKVNFRHGFSTFIPTSIDDAATRPPSDVKSHLSIQLVEADGVELKSIQFKDRENHDIGIVIPFRTIDEKRKLYLTDFIEAPKELFKISILCHDIKNNDYLVRISPTLIEPSTILEPPKPKSPIVSIDGEPRIVTDSSEPLRLKCKIQAYPKPNVRWIINETGEIINSTLLVKELPYDYISIADVANVNKNETYGCHVVNKIGDVKKFVDLVVKNYFKVLESPKDTTIEYENKAKIHCNIIGSPTANIFWFKEANEINNENIEISDGNTTLTIKSMQPDLVGNYMCEGRNEMERKLFHFKLQISGIESPKINKTIDTIRIPKGSSVNINCIVIAGKPTPKIQWRYRRQWTNFQKISKDAVSIKSVDIKHAGVYRCLASNINGIDSHDTELIVEYPVTIKESNKTLNVRDSERVSLACIVDGVPRPNVRWFKDGTIITSSRTVHIYRDHMLKFTASLEHAGKYTCVAKNKYNTVNRTTDVNVYVPVSIESPKESVIQTKVGSSIILSCHADGYPRPSIQWLFYNKSSGNPVIMESNDYTLHLQRLQIKNQGYYVCSASNIGGIANITYDVQVLAPPVIENVYPDKTFRAVEGDLALTIPCKATGSPNPVITWEKNGLKIPSGTEWYNIDNDGTLVIINIDYLSAGLYVCEAKNYLGADHEVYEVVVEAYPRPDPVTKTIIVETGKPASLICDISHTFIDKIRWYKDGRLIGHGEHLFLNVKPTDAGIYTCRVSNVLKSRSGNTKLVIGFKPQFQAYADEEIPFEEGTPVGLDCEAVGVPTPKVFWYHNEIPLNDTEMYKVIQLKFSDIGIYTCEVTNDFGKISRNFEITTSDCILDISRDLSGNQPLMYSSPFRWTNFDSTNGYMRIPKNEYMSLYCPTNFQNFPKRYITAFCEGASDFKVDGRTDYQYSDMKCTDYIKPIQKGTRITCYGSRGELTKVGYTAFGNFLEAFEVCFDFLSNCPIYAKHIMTPNTADVEPEEILWHDSSRLRLNLEDLYDCNGQIDFISRNLGRWFHIDDKCCFSRRQLVNPKDMVPGLAQIATYSNLNVVPHWSTCSDTNWVEVENRVRLLAKSIPYELTVYTGIYNNLRIQKNDNTTWFAQITDGSTNQAVPEYIWKVIQDSGTRSSLAIIQINIPDLSSADVNKYILCEDVCGEIHWMRNDNWHDVTQGYTYCCNLKDFMSSFGFDVFNKDYSGLLYDVASITSHSLT